MKYILKFNGLKVLTLSLGLLVGTQIYAQWHIDGETGLAINTFNEVQFPNGSASDADRINFINEFGNAQTWFYRFRAGYTINKKHTISALYAPLQFTYNGNLNNTYKIGETNYMANVPTEASYQFNSYRLTYRYEWFNTGTWQFGIGITGKIRDAKIAIEQAGDAESTTDFGFVPLINFKLQYLTNSPLVFTLRGDALVGTQGRAEDVFAGVLYRFSPKLYAKLGYRFLDGGADVDQVYNFAFVHYASTGIRLVL